MSLTGLLNMAPTEGTHLKRNLLWYLRIVAIGFYFAGATLVALPIFFVRFRSTKNNGLFTRMVAPISRKILGFRVISRNRGKVEPNMPCVFTMNHQAALDILVNSEIYPDRCVLIAKKSLAWIPVFGWLLYLSGNLLLDKANRKHSISKMNQADEAIQNRKLSIWIFPEGTRSYGAGLGQFKKGAFHCALKNQVPIVPVVVSTYAKGLDFNRLHAGSVIIDVLDPIQTAGKSVADLESFIAECHSVMLAAIERLDLEVAAMDKSRAF